MKKLISSLFSVAVIATAFTACSKDETEATGKAPRDKEITVLASSDLKTVVKSSRTILDPTDNTVSWNETGEYLKVFETIDATTTAKTSAEGVVTEGKAAFGVTFTENTTATSFMYNAVYPASALSVWSDTENQDVTNLRVVTPTTQQPSATSFDGAADLLIAYPETQEAQPDQLSLRFARMVAIGKMTIKNLNTTENISSVQFQASGKVLSGRSYIDLTAGTAKQYGYTPFDNVVLDYTGKEIAANGLVANFCCFPFELLEGDTFTVTVTTPTKRFTKTVTLTAGRTLAFNAGQSSTFNVNMDGIVGENTVADLRQATLTFEEIKAEAGEGWGSYGKLYEYTQPSGAIWGIMGFYQNGNTFIQLGATDKQSYVKLPDFSKPITAVVVTLSQALSAGKKLLLTSGPTVTTGDIGSVTATAGQTAFTFDIAGKNVNTAYLRADAPSRVVKIEANAGAAIVAPALLSVPAEESMGDFTYSVAGFETEDDTVITYDGTVVELAEIDKTTNTVSYMVTATTDFAKGRTGTITLASAANDATTIISVEQAANVLTVVPAEIAKLGGNAGDQISFSVTTAFKNIAYEGTNATFSVAPEGNMVTNADGTYTYTYTVTAVNAGAEAEATLGTLTFYQTIDGKRVEPTEAVTVPIVQSAAGATGTAYYVKVTEAPADGDWSGTYIIAEGNKAANGTITSKWLKYTEVTILNDQIESNADTDKISVLIEKNGSGSYTIRFQSGYLSTTNSNNGISVKATASTNEEYWNLSLTGTLVSIANVSYNTRIVTCNGTNGYRTYANASTGTKPSIYKLTN